MNPQDIDVSKRVKQFVALRDRIKTLDDEHNEKMKPFREALERLNGVLLDHLNKIGGNSVNTDAGTVYRTERKSAALTDPASFMKFVIENQAFDLMDRKANATAVEAFITEHKAPPPGVNFNRMYIVGVRRGSSTRA